MRLSVNVLAELVAGVGAQADAVLRRRSRSSPPGGGISFPIKPSPGGPQFRKIR
jgi:hypothetical protein